jgi:DNA-binding NarL/FixJ family response regulator
MPYSCGPLPPVVGVIASEPIRLTGLVSVFDNHPSIQIVLGDLDSIFLDFSVHHLVLDLGDSARTMETQTLVRKARPDIRQVVLGPAGDDELILRSLRAGARAYLDFNCGPLAVRQAVEAVIQGSIWAPRRLLSMLIDRLLATAGPGTPAPAPVLSPRERQVLDLIMTARSNREIAVELGIEERTVKAYVTSLLRKTGSDNRVSLSVQATQVSLRDQQRQLS